MAGPLIAVLDDDPAFLNMMQLLLTQEGYRTIPWREGQSAVEMIRRERPDVVIVDLHMARSETGWGIIDELRRHPETTDLPVIVCSGDSLALREKAAFLRQSRCVALEKPFDLDDLLDKVRASAAGSQGRCGAG